MSTDASNQRAILEQSRKLLLAHPVRGVSAEDLAKVIAACKLRRMSNEEVLCAEGDPGDAMFFLLDGAIRVTRTDPHGRTRALAVVESPALVGHMALIDNSPRSATCAASGRTIIASLERRTWNNVLNEPSRRGAALRRVLCASLTRQLVGANASIRTLVDGTAIKKSKPSTPSTDLGHKTTLPPNAASARLDTVEDFDASESDLLRVAGVLDGWRIDRSSLKAADRVKHVYTEDQKRNRKNLSD